MDERKISVIIPCYNASPYVDRCMESLEKQTIGIENLEIIMVNDASTDATLGKLLLWEMKYPKNIMVIPLQENVMQGAARNIARGYCTGEYIAYLDIDDWLVPTAYEKAYDAAKANNAQIVNFLYTKVYGESGKTEQDITEQKPNRLVEIHNLQERTDFFTKDCPLVRGCWDKLYLREFVEEHDLLFAEGVYDEESLFTTPAYLNADRFYFLNEYLYMYYQNPISTSYNLASARAHRDDNARTWMATYNRLKETGLLDKYHDLVEQFFVINYFIRSCLIAAERGVDYDAATIQEMQDTVHQLFPDYRENKNLMSIELFKEPMKLIEIPVTEENIDSFNEAWRIIVHAYPDSL